MSIPAKFHACITKCTILLKKMDLSAGLTADYRNYQNLPIGYASLFHIFDCLVKFNFCFIFINKCVFFESYESVSAVRKPVNKVFVFARAFDRVI